MSDEKVMAAVRRVSEALKPFTEGEPDLMDAQEACLALEECLSAAGYSSLHVRKLRRELKKRGLNRVTTGDKA